jgi:hypothetical protein
LKKKTLQIDGELKNQDLVVASKKMTVFWDTASCTFADVGRRFRGTYYFHHQAIIALMSYTSETSANFYQTTRHTIPEHCHF